MDQNSVPQPPGSGAGKRKALGILCKLSGRSGRVVYFLAFESLLLRLRYKKIKPALIGVPLVSRVGKGLRFRR